MNAAFSRSQFPPGGWQFYQPQTGWSPPTPIASTFDQTVTLIIKHRLANGAIVAQHNLSTNFDAVAAELETFNKRRLGIPDQPSPKSLPPRSLPQAVAAAVAAVGKMADGIGLLLEWLPEGKSVAPELSEKRAHTCAHGANSQPCPFNGKGDLTSWFSVPVSEKLRKMTEARKDLKLETSEDQNLGVCNVCLCPLKLKVHVPMDFVEKHTKPETMAQFPSFCWIARRDQ